MKNRGPFLSIALLLASAYGINIPVKGQTTITPTASFGSGGMITTTGMTGSQTVTIPASAGVQSGANLFHSFSQFDVGMGDTAKFTDTGLTTPMTINNIIARIYSASASSINGNILVDTSGHLASANLFLINPNGVIFGKNSSISVPGDFVVSTANYTKLNDGTGIFYSDPTNASSGTDNLTSAPVSAFGFFKNTTLNPNGITVNGGASLVAGGSLQFVTSNFTATSGTSLSVANTTLGIFSGAQTSTTADATVPYLTGSVTDYSGAANFATTSGYGKVTLGDATHPTGGASLMATGTGGKVVIRGGQLVQLGTGGTISGSSKVAIQEGSLTVSGTISTQTGTIGIDTTGDVTMTSGTITAQGGSITLGQTSLDNLTLDSASSITETAGSGGSLNITSTGTINNGGSISTVGSTDAAQITAGTLNLTTGSGVSGSITASGGALTLGTTGNPLGGLSLASGTKIAETSGTGGTLAITSNGAITNGGTISTAGSTQAVQITAPSLGLSGTISTTTSSLKVDTTGALTLTGGTITSQGDSITLGQTNLGSLSLDGTSSITETAGSGGTLSITSTGTINNGGSISTVGSTDSAQINAGTLNLTTANSVSGSITAAGGTLTLGTTGNPLGSLSLASGTMIGETSGSSGTVTIKSSGAITNGGTISTAGSTQAVQISAQSLGLSGTVSTTSSSLNVDTTGALALTGGTITSQSGAITLGQTSLGSLSLDSTSSITETGTSGSTLSIKSSGAITNGGTISTAGSSEALQISAQSLGITGTISTASSGINVDTTGDVTLTGGTISSQGGTITLGQTSLVNLSLDSASLINSVGGTVNVNATGDIDLTGGSIESTGMGSTNAGNVNVVDAFGNITLTSGAEIASISSGSGNAGNVTINNGVSAQDSSKTLTITGTGLAAYNSSTGLDSPNTGIFSLSTGTGGAGEVNVIAIGNVVISAGGQIASVATNTAGGNAQSVTLTLNPNNLFDTASNNLTIGGVTASATTTIPVIYSSTANATGTDGGVSIYALSSNVELQAGAAIQTSSQDTTAGDVIVETSSLTLDSYSAIQSVMSQTNPMDGATTGKTGDVSVLAFNFNLSNFAFTGPISIASNAFIQTVANPNTSGFNPVGQVTVYAGSLTEGGKSVPTATDGYDYAYKIKGDTQIRMLNSTTLNAANGSDVSTGRGPIVENLVGYPSSSSGNLPTPPAGDGIVLDGTLGGTAGPIIPVYSNPTYTYTINESDGTVAGNNLFLSFSEFDLGINHPGSSNPSKTGPVNETAVFEAPGIANILARVTGGQPSQIDGTLAEASDTTANLFFLNPSGVLFTANSSLNLNGALTVSTANYIQFGSGGTLDTQINPLADAALTTTPSLFSGSVKSFGFIDTGNNTPAPVAFDTATLSNDASGNPEIEVIAGDITLEDEALLNASQTLLFSAESSGQLIFSSGNSLATFPTVPSASDIFDDSTFGALGTVSLTGGSVLTVPSPNIASSILIRAGAFNLTDSLIVDQTTADAHSKPGQVLIDLTGAASITSSSNDSFISTAALGGTAGGSIQINAASLTINGTADNLFTTGILSTAQPTNFYTSDAGYIPFSYTSPTTATGSAGNITLDVSGQVTLSTFGQISADTNGFGNAGTISINGLKGVNSQLSISGGSSITSSTSRANTVFARTGNAGTVTVTASSVAITGSQSTLATSAGTSLITAGPTGNGGNITLTVAGQNGGGTGDISISSSGSISASSYNASAAGTVTITQSGSLDLANPATNPTVIGGLYVDGGSISTAANGTGTNSPGPNAGNITLNTQALTLNGGSVTSSTLGLSKAGNITINGINSGQSAQFFVVGNGGTISSQTGGTNGSGAGGTITIKTGALKVSGTNSAISTSSTGGTGNGGSIGLTVTGNANVVGSTGDVLVGTGGAISASSDTVGEAGTVTITQLGSLDLAAPATNPAVIGGLYIDGGSISTAANGTGTSSPVPNAGNITLNTQALTMNGGTITSSTSGLSKAGNITINGINSGQSAQFVIVGNGGTISSETGGTNGSGAGGTITLKAGALTVGGTNSAISTSSTDGTGSGGSIGLTVTGNAAGIGSTGDVLVGSGGTISASSETTGEAGTVTITQSGSLDLAAPATNPTIIGGLYVNGGTISTASNGTGTTNPTNPNAGNVVLNTQALTLDNGGLIFSGTNGMSKGGDIVINGVMSGQPTQFVLVTGAAAITSNTAGAGDGGTITIQTGSLAVSGGGLVAASANGGTGGGGSIGLTVTGNSTIAGSTGDVTITGGGTIAALSQTTGEAGTVTITQSGSMDITDPSLNPATNGGLYINGGLILTSASGPGTTTPSHPSAGNITLNTQALTLDGGGLIFSGTLGSSKGGDITINGVTSNLPTQFVIVQGNAQISSTTEGSGNGGTISINTGSLALTGANSAISTSANGGTGGGGSINLTVAGNPNAIGSSGDLKITNGGSISSSSQTMGEAGTVTIAQSDSLDTTDPSLNPTTNGGLYLNDGLITTAANGTGTANPSNASAGNIILNTEGLTMSGGSLILSSTNGQSKAGDVTVNGMGSSQLAPFVVMQDSSKIASETGGANGNGAGGTVTIQTGSVLVDNSSISTNATGGSGKAGDISIHASTGLASGSPFITVQNGSTIMSESDSTGAAGMITLQANMLTVTGLGSAISTNAGALGNTANSKGEILLSGQNLMISNSGLISSTTGGLSPGGTITAAISQNVSLSSGGKMDASSTAATGGGNGGSILIGSDPTAMPAPDDYGTNSPYTVTLTDGSVISCDSQNTNGGNIAIHAAQLSVNGNGLISTSEPNGPANTLGGDITIKTDTLFYLNNYSYIASNAGQGKGGNIRIDPQYVILNHSGIDAAGGSGNGNVNIDSNYVLSGDSFVVATGIVSIDSLPLDLTGSLIALPANLTNEEKRLRESCARAVNHEFSSLIVVGRGGTETAPDELNGDVDATVPPTSAREKEQTP